MFADWPIWAEPQFGESHGRPEERRQANAQNRGICRRREHDGQLVNIETAKLFSYTDACMRKGAAAGYDKAAAEAAQATLKEFLVGVFRLN
jgi:hypothetical protein